jgi:toxin HigB-1
MQDRIIRLLDRLNVATKPEDMSFAGAQFHVLKGFKPTRYTVHVNGPWCLTFAFEDGHAIEVSFVQYH